MKRSILLLISALMLSLTAWAQDAVESGTLDGGVSWTVDIMGMLTFTGSGEIPDVADADMTPWKEYNSWIGNIKFDGEITYVGENLFYNCTELKNVFCMMSNPPTLAANAFDQQNFTNILLFVPKRTYDAYANAPYWGQMGRITASLDNPNGAESIDWSAYPWVDNATGNSAYTEMFKVQKGGTVQVNGIQQPDWANEPGICITLPADEFTTSSLMSGQYAAQGANVCLYVSAFTETETELVFSVASVTYTHTVYKAPGTNNSGSNPTASTGSIDWSAYQWVNNASGNTSYTENFKVATDETGSIQVISIQQPGWASEPGIYILLPSADIESCSLTAEQYVSQGASMILYVSAFSNQETPVVITIGGTSYNLTVYNATGTPMAGGDSGLGDGYMVYWSVNGDIHSTTTLSSGELISDLPEVPTVCDGYTFAGWTDTPISGSQTWPPSILYYDVNQFPSVSQDITYYAVFNSIGTGGGTYEMVDELTFEITGIPSSTNYTDWSVSTNSGTMYTGNSAGGNSSIQLKSSGNTSGIINTNSVGEATKITVTWNSQTINGRVLNVYGSYSPFSSISDLYSSATVIGTLTYDGTSTSELMLSGGYPYIGLRSASNAMYISSISIVWSTAGAGSSTEYVSICGGGSQSDAVSGQVTPYIAWSLSGGKLTITGSGAMPDYQSAEETPWFPYASQITDATVDEGIVYIGNYTFAECLELMNVMFPRSLKSIGINIFTQSQNNHAIALNMNAFIPPSITESTFGNVAGVLYIYVWESVQTLYVNRSIWEHLMVFTNPDPSGTTIGIMNDNLVWYFGGQEIRFFGEGVIPDYEDASQQPWADFREGTRNLYVEAELTRIGSYAFSGFSNIFTMELPSTLQEIGSYAFENCTNIAEIDIKGVNQVVTVNSLSFNGVSPLSGIGLYVPESMVSAYASDPVWGEMGVGALPEDNPTGGITGTVGELSWTLYDGELIIDGTGTIPDFPDDEGLPWAPYKEQIFTIKLNGDISSIGTYAFAGLTNLTTVNTSYSLNYVGPYAFMNCQSLTMINMPVEEMVAVDADAFSGCVTSNITLYVPAGLAELFRSAEVWGFMNVVSNEGGSGDGKLLDSGECGPSATWELYESGLLLIKGSSYIYGYAEYQYVPWYEYRQQINAVQVEEGIESLTKYAFFECVQLSSITLPSTLCCIDDSTFFNCIALRSIACNSTNPPSVNGEHAFENVTLSEITLTVPEGSGYLYEYADYWRNMQVQEQGGGTDPVVEDEYSGVIGETLVWTLKSGILTFSGSGDIPDYSMYGSPWAPYREQIDSVIMTGASISQIGKFAFTAAKFMKKFISSSSLTYVADSAFYTCERLQQIIIMSDEMVGVGADAFEGATLSGITLYVNASLVSAYQTAEVWGYMNVMAREGSTVPELQEEYVTIGLTHDWTFIMLPSMFGLSENDITIDGEVEWARYDGEKRAGGQSGWMMVDFSMSYYKDWGHIVRAQGDSATLIIKVPMNANSSSADIQLRTYSATHEQNANWNFVGNPYNASYDIAGLKAAGITSPIAVWNGVGYTTYDPEFDEYTLLPFEPFFIQLPGTDPQTIHLSPEYIVGYDGDDGNTGGNDEGALSGYFSVGEGVQVRFSKGNLQYYPLKDVWQFAENQYDTIGIANANISADYDGWIDLFGWGTGANPTLATQNAEDYAVFTDWGNNPINNGGYMEGLWRTLTSDEWNYLFTSRTKANKLRGVASVNGVNGMILLPDGWYDGSQPIAITTGTGDFSQNTLTSGDWEQLESAGAVFLPAVGYRSVTGVNSAGTYGLYWSATPNGTDNAYRLNFGSDYYDAQDYNSRNYGYSVRLVR